MSSTARVEQFHVRQKLAGRRHISCWIDGETAELIRMASYQHGMSRTRLLENVLKIFIKQQGWESGNYELKP